MKKYTFILIAVVIAAFSFSSCKQPSVTADGLALPLVRALKAKDFQGIKKLVTPKDGIDEAFANNPGKLGRVYYNKYTTDYRYETVLANVYADFDIITRSVTEHDKLDWSNVAMGPVSKENVSDADNNYTSCKAKLLFPSGTYTLMYDAVQVDGYWYLMHQYSITLDKG